MIFMVLSVVWGRIEERTRNFEHLVHEIWPWTCGRIVFKFYKMQTKSENHETCRDVMISYVEDVINIWEGLVQVITYDAYTPGHCIFRKNSIKWNKLNKYSKQFGKCTKFRHGVPSTVRGLQKKFGGQNTKKNWFAECHLLTLGKYALCRVPDGRHSAKCSLCRVFVGTLGKERANFF